MSSRYVSRAKFPLCSMLRRSVTSYIPYSSAKLHRKGDSSASTGYSPIFTENSGDNSRWNHSLQEVFELHILINFTNFISTSIMLQIPIGPEGLSMFSHLICACKQIPKRLTSKKVLRTGKFPNGWRYTDLRLNVDIPITDILYTIV